MCRRLPLLRSRLRLQPSGRSCRARSGAAEFIRWRIREVHLLVGVVIAAKAVKRAAGVGVTRRIVMPSGFHTAWTHTRHRQYGFGRPEADARTVEQRRRCRSRPVLLMEVCCPFEGRGQLPWYRCIAVDRCLPLGLGFNSALGQKRWNFALCEQRSQQPSETVLFLGSDDAPACFQEIHPSLAEVFLVHFVLLENV